MFDAVAKRVNGVECAKYVDRLGTDQCPEFDISVLGMI